MKEENISYTPLHGAGINNETLSFTDESVVVEEDNIIKEQITNKE